MHDTKKKTPESQRSNTDQLIDISNEITEIQTDLKWHRRIGWTLAGTYATIFGAILTLLLTWYIPEKFNDKLPDNLKETFPALSQKVQDLQDRLNRLTPTALDELIPHANAKNAGDVASRLQQASGIVDAALKSEIPGDPVWLDQLQSRVSDIRHASTSNLKIFSQATETEVRLDGYRWASINLLKGLKTTTQSPQEPNISSFGTAYFADFDFFCTNSIAHFIGFKGTPVLTVAFRITVNTCGQNWTMYVGSKTLSKMGLWNMEADRFTCREFDL